MRTVASGVWACLLLCSIPVAVPAEASPNDLAKRARTVLQKHCYRCHGENGRAVAGVYVLNRQRLIDRKKLLPGDPAKSRLYKAVRDEEMPPAEVKERPGKEEIDIIRRWIIAKAPDFAPEVSRRPFITVEEGLQIIENDLKKNVPVWGRKFTRYFTLTHLYNAGISDDELQSYRHGLSKLINSLSWVRQIAIPTPIDRAKTIFRIDLRDYGWDPKTWQAILSRYPYGMTLKTKADESLQSGSGTVLPYVRGDWFVFAASRPPLYHDVLGISATVGELEKRLKIRRSRVVRAGFNGSGVSRNNRLIERHLSPSGSYWKSYDFASNEGRRNLFRHPLGPTGKDAFTHDGGEMIFSLPNGLQGYMLVDAKGKRLDKAPVEIVSTGNRLNPVVVNGISCMECHARGMIFKDDQVGKAVAASDSFSDDEKDAVKALYPLKDRFDELLREDVERFRKAVEKTGDAVQKTDTVVLLAARFEEELDLKLAAAEAGLKPEELLRGLKRSVRLGRALAPLHVGGTVKRDTFVEAFGAVVRDLNLGVSIPLTPLPPRPRTLALRLATSLTARTYLRVGSLDAAKVEYRSAFDFDNAMACKFGSGGGTKFEQRQRDFKRQYGFNRLWDYYRLVRASDPDAFQLPATVRIPQTEAEEAREAAQRLKLATSATLRAYLCVGRFDATTVEYSHNFDFEVAMKNKLGSGGGTKFEQRQREFKRKYGIDSLWDYYLFVQANDPALATPRKGPRNGYRR